MHALLRELTVEYDLRILAFRNQILHFCKFFENHFNPLCNPKEQQHHTVFLLLSMSTSTYYIPCFTTNILIAFLNRDTCPGGHVFGCLISFGGQKLSVLPPPRLRAGYHAAAG